MPISHAAHAQDSLNKGLKPGSVTFCSCCPQTHTCESQERGFSLIFLLLRQAGSSAQLTNLHSPACSRPCVPPPRALTPSIFLYGSPTPHNQPFPLLKTANPMCAFPTYRQEKESTLRALTETLGPACLSLRLL